MTERGYTPTTDEVREDFAFPWDGHVQNTPARLQAFNRWFKNELDKAWLLGRSSGVVTALNRRSWELSPYRAESDD
jgi:hypothetical protein